MFTSIESLKSLQNFLIATAGICGLVGAVAALFLWPVGNKIEKLQEPRRVSPSQETQIISRLKTTQPQLMLQIMYPPGDDEARNFSEKLNSVFLNGRWWGSDPIVFTDSPLPQGITIDAGPATEPEVLKSFLDLFEENGVHIAKTKKGMAKSNLVYLYVGPK